MKRNTFNWILSIIMLFACSCKTTIPQTNVDTIKFDESTNEVTPEIENLSEYEDLPLGTDTFTLVPMQVDTLIPNLSAKKDLYKVALILPFMGDSVRSSWSHTKEMDFKDFKTSLESEVSLSFLEGMLMAFKDVNFNSKFEIQVYDDRNRLAEIDSILSKIDSADYDIIIGPYSKKNVLEVSKFAAKNNIVHISPFSPSKSASFGNSKYYMLEPSLEQHILTMVDYAIDSIKNVHIKILYPSKESGNQYALLVKDYLDLKNASLETNKISYSLNEIGKGEVDATPFKNPNVVTIVNSFSESYVNGFLRGLGSGSGKAVFGMPGWENSEILRLEHISKGNVHFTKSSWINEESDNVIFFKKFYEESYKKQPNEYAFLGYDAVGLFLKIIDEYGLNFNNNLVGYQFEGLSRKYVFKKAINSENEVVRVENSFLHIYKIDEYEQILVK